MNTLVFVDKSGKQRTGIEISCICGNIFISRKDQVRKYCSKSCSELGSRKRVKVLCATCGKPFEKLSAHLKGSKSGLYFCCRVCKDKAQRIGGIKEIMPPHYGTGNGEHSYRSLFNTAELVCTRCGYKEFDCAVDIHHKDKNRENNTKENLIPLCSNCHRALHNNKWNLETKI